MGIELDWKVEAQEKRQRDQEDPERRKRRRRARVQLVITGLFVATVVCVVVGGHPVAAAIRGGSRRR